MAKFQYTRGIHEQFAIEAMNEARYAAKHSYGCSPEQVYSLVRANRSIARARTHLASIGGDEGKRTKKLWGALQRAERQVDLVGNRVAKCLLK